MLLYPSLVLICTQLGTNGIGTTCPRQPSAFDPVIKKRLEKLAKSTGRSRSFLAAEAINEYLNLNEWQGTPQRPLTTPRWPRPALWPDRGQSSSR